MDGAADDAMFWKKLRKGTKAAMKTIEISNNYGEEVSSSNGYRFGKRI